MTRRTAPHPPSAAPSRRRALVALGGLGLAAAGCGGGSGGELAGVGSGGTGQVAGSYATGTISGFGSVIVNGVKYDDSAARVTDDAGRARPLGQLAIGMVVEVEGRGDEATGLGTAERIRMVSEARGAIESIDAAARRFTVLGTTVQTGAATVFPEPGGLAALATGDRVEVYGFADRDTGTIRATCIERRAAGDADGRIKLRGTIAELDATRDTFRLGVLRVDVRSLRELRNLPSGGLRNGLLVWIESTAAPAAGAWRPDGELTALHAAPVVDGTHARVEGAIDGFSSVSAFRVAGVPVDASGASFMKGATQAGLRDGLRVRVHGLAVAGRVVATRVELREDHDVSGASDDDAELKGTIVRFTRIADFAVRDAAGRVFLVDASLGTLAFEDGTTLADLRVGAVVEIRGRRGAVVVATRIKVER
ncbi:MAG: DUF5666 domain-containing protein [Burkholderiales bacterium]